ncbi:MAG: Wzy polymerase domain-containing protein, partial [Rhodoferax sp.]
QWVAVLLMCAWWWRAGAAPRQALRLCLAALGLYLLALLALPSALQVLTGTPGNSLIGRFADAEGCGGRRVLWANVLYLIGQRPWSGVGWGELDYAHFMAQYPGPRFCDILDNAHNLPLHLAVELGVPLALLVCLAALAWVWRARPWRETDATRQLAWGVLALLLLHSMVEYPLWYGPFQLAGALSLWLLLRRPGAARGAPPGAGAPALLAMLVVAASAALWALAWDYWRVSQLYLAPAERASAYREDTRDKVRGSWWFEDQVLFAELTTTTLTPANAGHLHALALRLLHFSPEPRVVQKLIESATLLGLADEALLYQQRFKAAFADEYARWAASAVLPAAD